MTETAVEQIKDRLPITDVLSSYITLIPAGRQYKAKCPFHNERTASFSVSPERGLYYCFGCGARGDIFTFVQQFEGVDFFGSLKILAVRAGVELTREEKKEDNFAPLYEFLEKTTLRYQNELKKNSTAVSYLKGRGLTEETIVSFRIGYAPQEWRFVANDCRNDEEVRIAERVGLIKKPEGTEGAGRGHYDRFRGRIMFPLSDSSGRVVGFSGRMYPDGAEGPKYLNSPETEIFQKSRILYGFDKAKQHIRKVGFSILVEGQMDLLLSHQHGFRNTVATSGTAVSQQTIDDEHANLRVVARLSPHLFLAFDGDAAGQKALSNAALVALSIGMNPKVVRVPEGLDPADFLSHQGAQAWKLLLQHSDHFLVHQAKSIKERGLSPHMLVQALRESVFPYLSKITSPLEQSLYIEAIAKELHLSSENIRIEHERYLASQPAERSVEMETKKKTVDETILPKHLLAAFLTRFPLPELHQIKERVEQLAFKEISFGALTVLDNTQDAAVFAVVEREYGQLEPAELVLVGEELASKITKYFFDDIRSKLSSQLRQAEERGDEEEATKILSDLALLGKMRMEGGA